MPNCKLIWGSSASHSLTLEVGRRGLQTTYKQESKFNQAASGKIETIKIYGIQEMATDLYITADKYRDAVAWWSWVSQGKAFAFANSASNTGSTTLASAASASSTSVDVVSDTGFAASDTVMFRSASSIHTFELAKVSAVSSSTVTLTAGLSTIMPQGQYFGTLIIGVVASS